MHILENVSLRLYSTMRLGGTARFLVEVKSSEEVAEAVIFANNKNLSVLVVGGGSNIVWRDEGFPGLIIVNRISGLEINDTEVVIGAGENWDSVVARTVEAGLSGIECLSLIPGSAGATPVQNVEAYGQQIAETLIKLEAYDVKTHEMKTIVAADCAFGYRTSRFKTTDKERFIITKLSLRLSRNTIMPPFHQGLQSYVDQNNITDFSPASLRQCVINIRSAKLPDPAHVANNGSFFVNPIIEASQFQSLLSRFPDINHYPVDNGREKIPARWLIENAGFEGAHDEETGMATWPKQSLVLVNEHAHTTADLLKFKQKIVDAVQAKFGITLEQEPELLP